MDGARTFFASNKNGELVAPHFFLGWRFAVRQAMSVCTAIERLKPD